MRAESGQSLVLIVLAMTLIVGIAAYAIDTAEWQVGHHKAQIAADATALAAANCLASQNCTSTTATGDASTKANSIASANGYNPTANVNLAYTSSTVKATVTTTVASTFAGFFGLSSARVSATATASYYTTSRQSWSCTTNCVSLFAGNTTCPASTPPAYYIGLNLVTNDNGGGSSTMSNAFTNGYYYNGASSGTYTASGPACAKDNERKPNNTTFTTVPTKVPYPAAWTQPACAHSASSWSTATVTSAGVYCATGTVGSGSCTSTASGAGTINVTLGSLTAGAYEFVGPCVVLNGSSTTVTSLTGEPLVYGTSHITTLATSTALPTCTAAAINGSAGTTTWLTGNGSSLNAPIYDQCGTFEETGNSGFEGFVEAWNIAIDKNNLVTGTGPVSATNPQTVTSPGGDSLTG